MLHDGPMLLGAPKPPRLLAATFALLALGPLGCDEEPAADSEPAERADSRDEETPETAGPRAPEGG